MRADPHGRSLGLPLQGRKKLGFVDAIVQKTCLLLDLGSKIDNLVAKITGMTNLALQIDAKSIPDAKTPTPVVQSTCKTTVLEQKTKTKN